MCEKRLDSDFYTCLDSGKFSSIDDVMETDPGNSSLYLSLPRFATASTCIQFCRGLDQKYAAVEESRCVCGTGLKFNETFGGDVVSNKFCPTASRAQQFVGDEKYTSVFRSATDQLYHGETPNVETCHALSEELNVVPEGFRYAMLQPGLGRDPLRVDCDRDNLCLRNVLAYLPESAFAVTDASGSYQRNQPHDMRSVYEFSSASFALGTCSQFVAASSYLNVGNPTRLCNSTMNNMTSVVEDTDGNLRETAVVVTLPTDYVLVGVDFFAQQKSYYMGWIKKVKKVEFSLPASLGGGNRYLYTSGYLGFDYETTGNLKRSPKYFRSFAGLSPVVTNQITFTDIQIEAKRPNTSEIDAALIRNVAFQMKLFGCPYQDVSIGNTLEVLVYSTI